MAVTRRTGAGDDDPGTGPRFSSELMHAAATLYYLEDATQAEVASRLATSRATVSRLLSEARRRGIVRIDVVDPDELDTDLGPRLAEALGLSTVYVAPVAHESMLGASLAPLLSEALSEVGLREGDVLLVSSGRTVWQSANSGLPRLPGIVVTPTVGGQDEPEAWYQTNEITRVVAEKVGGRPAFLYAPALPGPQLHERLLEDPGTRRVLELWENARCAVLGVGAPALTRASMPAFFQDQDAWVRQAVGDICTRFYDDDGRPLAFPGSERLIATSHDLLRRIEATIAVAVGPAKIPSLLAATRACWFNTLVTDSATAVALLAAADNDHRS